MPLPDIEPIPSPRLTLRTVRIEDLPALLTINGDPEVTRFLPYPTWASIDDGRAWLERMEGLTAAGATRQLVITLNATAQVIGTFLVFRYDEGSARAEVGYVLGRKHWGQGLMHEALRAFCRHAYTRLGLRRLEAEVNPDNAASNAVLQRVGFRHEGTFRQRWVAKGRAYDTHFYGLLASDWSDSP
ncbi:MAG: GNAT family N-acetyltransferase [Proteobacteria bacterium]|nr:GNAT family N-acetyltransferase [Pseudomonadota bacterium]